MNAPTAVRWLWVRWPYGAASQAKVSDYGLLLFALAQVVGSFTWRAVLKRPGLDPSGYDLRGSVELSSV